MRVAVAGTRTAVMQGPYKNIIVLLILSNALSVLLFALRIIGADNTRYWFMVWNLTLAWIAPVIAWILIRRLHHAPWKHWLNIVLTMLWLGFLPNSFYMVSDLIHVELTGEVNIIFDAVLFTSFIFNGFIAGYLGTYLVHRELLKRMTIPKAYVIILAVFMLSSYAVYMGRVLRWNTWDALLQPAAVLFDVSDTIVRPLSHADAYVITGSFTLLISVFYLFAFEIMRTLRGNR